MVKGNADTLQETILRDELSRIRETYSFKLGLLITESLIRKPWKIIFFPFRLIFLTYSTILSKANRKILESSEDLYDENCIMLFVASEGGAAAYERTKFTIDKWLKQPSKNLVIITSNTDIALLNNPRVSIYMIPDPKDVNPIPKTQWNKICENVVYRAIYTHLPTKFIFDGIYPYRGILNAIDSAEWLERVWIHSERVKPELVEMAEKHFSSLKISSIYEDNSPLQSEVEAKVISTNGVLLATDYGYHSSIHRMPKVLLRFLSTKSNINLVGIRTPNEEVKSSLYSEHLEDILISNIDGLKAAIISENIDLLIKLYNANIPTLCILNSETSKQARKKIYNLARKGKIFVCGWDDNQEILLYTKAIFDNEWNLSMRTLI
jgi:hypothetical protein